MLHMYVHMCTRYMKNFEVEKGSSYVTTYAAQTS